VGERVGFGIVVWVVWVGYRPVAGSFVFDVNLLLLRGPIGIGAGVKEDVVPAVVYEFNRFWSGSLFNVVTGSEGRFNPKGFSFQKVREVVVASSIDSA
jgi:hypothetical protein